MKTVTGETESYGVHLTSPSRKHVFQSVISTRERDESGRWWSDFGLT